jgi:hypothetical protein
MIVNLLFLVLFSFQDVLLPAFENNFETVKIYINERNQLFFINKQSIIISTDLQGNELFTFEDKTHEITAIDASNPMRILAHSNTFNTLAFLDQTLTPINDKILLDLLNIPFTKAFGTSRDNSFWIFDEQEQTLNKIDQNGKIKSVSQKIYMLTNETFNPELLIERNNLVYLVDKTKGVLCFDFMGTYKFWYKDIQSDKIEIVNQQIIYLQNSQLFSLDTQLMETKKINLPLDFIDDFCINKNKLVLLQGKKVYILPINI